MRIKIQFLTGIGLWLAVLGGCTKDTVSGNSDEGELLVNLLADVRVTEEHQVETKSSSSAGTDIDEYAILITQNGEPYAGFDTYKDLPENKKIRLNQGDYSLKAYWGKDEAASWSPYFEGNSDFSIIRTETTSVDVVCKPANVEISILYTDSFKEAFKQFVAYRTEVTTDLTKTPWVFSSEETRSGYFKTSPFVVTVVFTKATGEAVYYSFPKIEEGVAAGNHYVISLRGKGVGDPEAGLSIEVDETTNDVSETYEIEYGDVFKNVPSVQYSFNNQIPYELVVKQPVKTDMLMAYVKSEAGLGDVRIKSADALFADNGLPETVSLKAAETDAALAAKLKNIGFEWDGLSEGTVSGKLVFTGLLSNLDLTAGSDREEHVFSVEVVDRIGQTSVSDFTIVTKRPVFVPSVTQGQLWARYAYVKPLSQEHITEGDFDRMRNELVYEYSSDQADWTAYRPEETGFTEIAGLNPNTTYYWRVRYQEYVSPVVEFKTEPEAALPNGNMEQWTNFSTINSYDGEEFCDWRPYSSTEAIFWGTNNPLTAQDDKSALYKRIGSTVRSEGVSGYGARLLTVGWGSGNTYVLGSIGACVVKNISPGKLIVGEIDASGNIIERGRAFSSRPLSLTYQYKYEPYHGRKYRVKVVVENRDDNQTIVLGQAEYTNGDQQTTYTEHRLPIIYDAEYLDLSATHIYIEFATAEVDDGLSKDDLQKMQRTIWDYNKNSFEGSNLYLDDIALEYMKQ